MITEHDEEKNIYRYIGLPFRFVIFVFVLPIVFIGECVLIGADGWVGIMWDYFWRFE